MKCQKKKLKSISVFLLLLGSLTAYSLELKAKQQRTLSHLGLAHENFDTTEEKINADFQKILELDKIRRGRSIAGKVLLPAGIIAACIGAKMISDGNKYSPRGR